jgi:ribonuclease G
MTRLLISSQPGELRLARLERGNLIDLRVEYGRGGGEAGDLHLGRVLALDRKTAAAFCDIGLEGEAFLPLDKAPKGLSEGDLLPLRITRAASGGKGPKAEPYRGDLPGSLAGQSAPCLLLRANDPVAALLEESLPPEEILLEEAAMLARLQRLFGEKRPELAARLKLHGGSLPLFESEGIEARIEALLRPEVPLEGGGRLWIEPTRALVAIDVDSAGAADPRKVNLAAAHEIARQLRLRGLAGLIAVDFLDPEGPEARAELRGAFEEALGGDPTPSELQRLSGEGVLLLTRRRLRPALHEVLAEPGEAWRPSARSQAFTALRAVKAGALSAPGKRPLLRADPAVLRLLEGEAKAALESLEKTLGAPLRLSPLPAPPEGAAPFELVLE